jgi:vacuolar protein-sorting-associated protein 4
MARASRPAIIFIDEIDSLCGSRSEGENDAARRIKTEFLVQMQGVGHNEDGILVLGATNIPWELDSAIRRRFERRIYIPLPDQPARAVMFKLNIGDTPNDLTEADIDNLAAHTEGFSGSDIATMVKSALMEPVRKCHKARFFRRVVTGPRTTPSKPGVPTHDDNSRKVFYTPCAPSEQYIRDAYGEIMKDRSGNPIEDEDVSKMTLMQVPQNCLLPPPVSAEDFYRILDSAKTPVSEADLLQHEQFTENFGMKGN